MATVQEINLLRLRMRGAAPEVHILLQRELDELLSEATVYEPGVEEVYEEESDEAKLTEEDWLYMNHIYSILREQEEEDCTDTKFRKHVSRPLQENKKLRHEMLRRWRSAGYIEMEGEDGTGERQRVIFWFIKTPTRASTVHEPLMTFEVFKKQGITTNSGNEVYRYSDNCWIILKTYNNHSSPKYKICTNHKGQGRNGGKWSLLYESREEALAEGYRQAVEIG